MRGESYLSQKDGRNEHVIVYASKGLSPTQKKFHPMEGECYALVWGMCISSNIYTKIILHYRLTINHWSGWLWCQIHMARRVDGFIPYKISTSKLFT